MGYRKSSVGVVSFSLLLILQISFPFQSHSEFVQASWNPIEGSFSDPNSFFSIIISYDGKCKERCERNRGGGYDHFLLQCISKYVSKEETVLCLNDCKECSPKYCVNETILCQANPELAVREAEQKKRAEEEHERKVNRLMESIEPYQHKILILVVPLVLITVAGISCVFGVYLCKQRKKPRNRKKRKDIFVDIVHDQELDTRPEDRTDHSTASAVSPSNVFNDIILPSPVSQSKSKNQSKSAGGKGKLSIEAKGAPKKKLAPDFRLGKGTSTSASTTFGTTASSSDMSFYKK